MALNLLTPTYQFYSTARSKIDGQDQPDVGDIVPSELYGTLVPNADGSYTLKMNFAIYLGLAGYPHAPIQPKFHVELQQDGSLKVTALDEAPEGVDIPEDFLNACRNMQYGPNGYQPTGGSRVDGIPGTVLASAFEDPARGVFPFRVSPQLDSDRLVKIDAAADCNEDGLPDAVAIELGLNPCLLDNRGDGTRDVDLLGSNWQRPLDTDRDGVPDVFEGRVDGNNTRVARNVRMPNNERITVTVTNKDRLGSVLFPHGVQVKALEPRWLGEPDSLLSMQSGIASPLPKADAQGVPYRYLGRLRVHSTQLHVPQQAYHVLWTAVTLTSNAEKNLATSEQEKIALLAQLESDPGNATVQRRLNTLESVTLPQRRATLATAQAKTTEWLNTYHDFFVEQLGNEVAAVKTTAELDAIMQEKGIEPRQDLRTLAPIRITFENGIPNGLKVFDIKDSSALPALPPNQLPESQDASLRVDVPWAPGVNEVFYQAVDDKTIEITSVDNNPILLTQVQVDMLNGNLDVETQDQVWSSANLGLVFAYTGEERKVELGVPDPAQPEEPSESSGGGGALG
ncbi:MAG: hypothetical protein WCY07_12855, partial [Pigmentiphaga sp.]